MAALLDIEEVMKILPHRYPMLLVDRIIESDFETKIVGIKNLTINELFFQGHFPGHPVMPGVLQLEAMAQVAGILLNRKMQHPGKIAYFLAIDNAKFRRIIQPGDQMRIEVHFYVNIAGICVIAIDRHPDDAGQPDQAQRPYNSSAS